ncbi:MAG: class I SAM-dependent methyltransferase [Betaproteobacteria bacterium HGW-Betaproteobacteria-13]|jgi:2-polyprenyl-3-methyl-5-hydroxy-6-metoxy-1,4-benzoquinol methylase|nr:MAG: class I SAM-dependent methyltransferase [Betaproteobacteria bacterium HGW-Betaproteobacteria-21]PKO81142.1 MAG: class I SAM-dependent methyltransferase [Betaproteobacteria bacterium HGW-Betaproteobacteria-13]
MNRDSYNAIASSWDAARVGFYGRERDYVDTLLCGLPAGAKVLDLGCGTGRPIAEYILAAGHALTGIDQSEALLTLARERFPQATWIHARIESFSTEERFHAIVCWDALFHIDRTIHEPLLRRFAAMLLPGGRMMLTCGGSEHPAFTDTMFGQPFHYDSHPPEIVLEMLAGLGFEALVSEFMNLPTSGRDKGRYAVVVRKT